MEIDRKRFLQLLTMGGASFLGLKSTSQAVEIHRPMTKWGRVKFTCLDGETDDWNAHPHGDLNFIDQMVERTSVKVENSWNVADVSKLDQLTRYPFLFIHAELPAELNDKDRANLREYLLRGGFLFAEDCVNGKWKRKSAPLDQFFQSMMSELPKILPEAKLERLPHDHPVFHCFYHLSNGIPHMQGVPHGAHGLTLNGRLIALLSPSDIHCGWTAGDKWYGPGKQKQALEMGTNIYVYAMTQEKGSDSVS